MIKVEGNVIQVAIKLILITTLVFFSTGLWYGRLEKKMLEAIKVMDKPQADIETLATEEILPETEDYQIVITRNIFQAAIADQKPVEKKEVPVQKQLEQTSLELSLEGTVSGSPQDARAIITDNKKKQQNMYYLGDSVQGAEIKSIERGKIILLVNGQEEELLLKENQGKPGADSKVESRNKSTISPGRLDRIKAKRKARIVRPRRPNSPPQLGQVPSIDNGEINIGDADINMLGIPEDFDENGDRYE